MVMNVEWYDRKKNKNYIFKILWIYCIILHWIFTENQEF